MNIRGLYAQVPHPIMLGFLLAFWATRRMSLGHLLFGYRDWLHSARLLPRRNLD